MRFVLKGRPLSDITKDPEALKSALFLCKFSSILRKNKKKKDFEKINPDDIKSSNWMEGQEATTNDKRRRADCFVYLIKKKK